MKVSNLKCVVLQKALDKVPKRNKLRETLYKTDFSRIIVKKSMLEKFILYEEYKGEVKFHYYLYLHERNNAEKQRRNYLKTAMCWVKKS